MFVQSKHHSTSSSLAAAITRAASQQTFYTIRFLVDRPLVQDAYRAYAYFRWLDDWLDGSGRDQAECLAFVDRQRALVESCYQGQPPLARLAEEEYLLVALIRADRAETSGLQVYIRNMLAVMAFDAGRRGRLISAGELADYTRWLATAVTEAMHYFIGHCCPTPHGDTRYLAVTGAHVTHMLRDTLEDVPDGYFNIPREYLQAHHLDPHEVEHPAYRAWVQHRVRLARACFAAGKDYLARLPNPRCRLAGYAYTARFEGVLAALEGDGYRLRSGYAEGQGLSSRLGLAYSALAQALRPQRPAVLPRPLTGRAGETR
jgi:phytoene/squalene synthetase